MKLCMLLLLILAASIEAGGKLKKCKAEVEALNAKVEVLEAQLKHEEKLGECEAEVTTLKEAQLYNAGSLFTPQRCGPENKVYSEGVGTFMVDATGGTWPADGMCSVLDPHTGANNAAYSITVDIYNVNTNLGHPGVMYNAKDNDNFDFVYFRPHSTSGCYQTGSVKHGALDWTNGVSKPCPKQPPKVQTWFTVKVVVEGDTSTVYLNGDLVTNVQPMNLPLHARGGFIVANGYDNQVKFRNIEIN